jgi:hypothetical protein
VPGLWGGIIFRVSVSTDRGVNETQNAKQGARQGHGIEKVCSDGYDLVNGAGLDQLLSNLKFGGPGIGRAVGQGEAGTTLFIQAVVENLDPQVVGFVGVGGAQGKARILFQAFLVHPADIEGWIGHDKVKLAQALVGILLIGVGLPDIAGQAVNGQVHLGQLGGPIF